MPADGGIRNPNVPPAATDAVADADVPHAARLRARRPHASERGRVAGGHRRYRAAVLLLRGRRQRGVDEVAAAHRQAIWRRPDWSRAGLSAGARGARDI